MSGLPARSAEASAVVSEVEKPPLGEMLVDHRFSITDWQGRYVAVADLLLRRDGVEVLERLAKEINEDAGREAATVTCLHPELLPHAE
jgi:hypothetical protein